GNRVLEAEAHETLRVLALVEGDTTCLAEDNHFVVAEVHHLARLRRAQPPALVLGELGESVRDDLGLESHGLDRSPFGFTAWAWSHGSSSSSASRIGQSLSGPSPRHCATRSPSARFIASSCAMRSSMLAILASARACTSAQPAPGVARKSRRSPISWSVKPRALACTMSCSRLMVSAWYWR